MGIISVFTGKNLNMFKAEGGSGYWFLQKHRVHNAKYLILIRNHRENWAVKDDGIDHGQAFMIGKISGCTDSEEYKGRKIIQISEYSMLPNTNNFKSAWKKLTGGQRYPVAYLNMDDVFKSLNIDLESLEWTAFNASLNKSDSKLGLDRIDVVPANELTEIIARAKEMVAHSACVDIDKVSIQISF